jgi:hypothetical protein
MRPITFAALIAASLAVSALATPCLGQTATGPHSALMAEAVDTTVRDGSDAGPLQTMPGQAEDASNVSDLPRIATHAPTPLGRPVPASEIVDSQ